MDPTGGYQREFIAEFYDTVPRSKTRNDLKFYIEQAQQSGGPVLEMGCGTGRVLIPTARSGVNITGIDLSNNMLSICRRKLQQETPNVQNRAKLVFGDIRNFDLKSKFKLVTIPAGTFELLITVEDQLSCLGNVYRHLDPGGQFLLEVFDRDLNNLMSKNSEEESSKEPPYLMSDGTSVVVKSKNTDFNVLDQTATTEIIYYTTNLDGSQERIVHSLILRHFFRFELEHLLARSGFEVKTLYADFDRSQYGSKPSRELIITARKRSS